MRHKAFQSVVKSLVIGVDRLKISPTIIHFFHGITNMFHKIIILIQPKQIITEIDNWDVDIKP